MKYKNETYILSNTKCISDINNGSNKNFCEWFSL